MNLTKEITSTSDLILDVPNLFQGSASPKHVECKWETVDIATSYSSSKALLGTLVVEGLVEKIAVNGKLSLHWVGPCRRCLEEAKGVSEISIQEIFEHDSTEGETFEFPSGEKLDLRPMLTEQALLNLPVAPLCSDSCEGPVDAEFQLHDQQKELEDNKPASNKDPRWSVLDALKFDDNENHES
ncbi:MAG TPA: YceD family protein [Acidimicrobiales bacterium]|nr:YceD family protein [Acidimicrobiales bacterium]